MKLFKIFASIIGFFGILFVIEFFWLLDREAYFVAGLALIAAIIAFSGSASVFYIVKEIKVLGEEENLEEEV